MKRTLVLLSALAFAAQAEISSVASDTWLQIGDKVGRAGMAAVLLEQQGGDIRIAFNVRYLNEVVRYMECDEIEMNMKSAISPCIVTPVDDKNYMHMVMPVRTNATNA